MTSHPRCLLMSREFPPGPGGIGAHAHALACGLQALGWETAVLAPQDYAERAEIARFNAEQGIAVRTLASRRGTLVEGFGRARALLRTVRDFGPDVVIASGQRQVWLCAALAGRHRRPWLAVGHGTEFGRRCGWQAGLTRRAFSSASAVACVSRFTECQMLALGVTPAVSAVIPNGADPARFRVLPDAEICAFARQAGLAGRRVVVTLGQVSARKGQEVVIRAMPRIVERMPDAVYVMVGLPTDEARLRGTARELGVEKHVRFVGRVDGSTAVRYLNACGVFAMTSRRTASGDCEGYGIAVVEAALCGKPAVVSAGSGLAEAVDDGRTGLTVPEGDSHATAEAIISLLADDGRRAAMGQAARARALAEQTWPRRVAQYDTLIQGLVAGDRAGARGRVDGRREGL